MPYYLHIRSAAMPGYMIHMEDGCADVRHQIPAVNTWWGPYETLEEACSVPPPRSPRPGMCRNCWRPPPAPRR